MLKSLTDAVRHYGPIASLLVLLVPPGVLSMITGWADSYNWTQRVFSALFFLAIWSFILFHFWPWFDRYFLQKTASSRDDYGSSLIACGNVDLEPFRKYRFTETGTGKLPKFKRDEWLIVEFGQSSGRVTIDRNGQTIDGDNEDMWANKYGYIIRFEYASENKVASSLIGRLPVRK